MKAVTIEGVEYEVPEHAEYVAVDEDGRWWWHEFMPAANLSEFNSRGEYGFITSSKAWKNTLRKI